MKKDRLYHALAGCGIALAIGLPCYLGSWSDCSQSYSLFSGLWGCLAGVVAGGVKEFADNQHKDGRIDWMDFGATCIGAVAFMLFILTLQFGRG